MYVYTVYAIRYTIYSVSRVSDVNPETRDGKHIRHIIVRPMNVPRGHSIYILTNVKRKGEKGKGEGEGKENRSWCTTCVTEKDEMSLHAGLPY